ncbi:MAG: hypothetical protein L6Q49_17170 [Anaerolineales bacterium]|nr:hypothetical protein [Anaerolineales bacterium]
MLIQIPIRDPKNPPPLKFPQQCINCGRPGEEMLGLTLSMGVQKRKQPVEMSLKIPMCKTCADNERSIAKVTLIPFLIGGFVIGVFIFVPVTLIAPEGTTPQTLNLPFVLGGSAGLIAGMIGGSVVEMVVKSLAVPFYGRLVTRRPLTALAFFSNSDQLIGIAAKYLRGKNLVQLEIENEELAREFVQINSLEMT